MNVVKTYEIAILFTVCIGVVGVAVGVWFLCRMSARASRYQVRDSTPPDIEEKYHQFRECCEKSGAGNVEIPTLDEYREYVSSHGFSSYDDNGTGLTDSQSQDLSQTEG
jgi:hypothetical protein